MNSYQVSVRLKVVPGMGYASTGLGNSGGERYINIITTTVQEAMSIARGKISDKEEIYGIYLQAEDVVVDYSHQQAGQC